MITQRKRPAIRVGSRLVGLPPDEPVTIPAPAKPGRPPLHGVAMTAAERTAASRAKRKAKLDDAERRGLIAKLMKIYNRQESDVVRDPKHPRPQLEAEQQATIRQQRSQYLSALKSMTLEQLRIAFDGKSLSDQHGRLPNERSGEGPRKFGQSEIEQIESARQWNTGKVKPEGAGPESFEVDDDDSPGAAISKPIDLTITASEKWKQRAFASLIGKMVYKPQIGGAKCPFCDEIFAKETSALDHFEARYAEGERDYRKWWDYSWAMQQVQTKGSMPPGGLIVDSGPQGLPYEHFIGVRQEMDLVKTAARKRKKPKHKPVPAGVS